MRPCWSTSAIIVCDLVDDDGRRATEEEATAGRQKTLVPRTLVPPEITITIMDT